LKLADWRTLSHWTANVEIFMEDPSDFSLKPDIVERALRDSPLLSERMVRGFGRMSGPFL
jgi:hypothetical protein